MSELNVVTSTCLQITAVNFLTSVKSSTLDKLTRIIKIHMEETICKQ